MSYSDYGAYVFKLNRETNEWERFSQGEDINAINFLNKNYLQDRPIENATGWKLDALVHSGHFGEDAIKDLDWTMHGIAGDESLLVGCYKQWVDLVLVNGEVYSQRKRTIPTNMYMYKVIVLNTEEGVAVYLRGTDDWFIYCGYGIGNHWWQNEEGYRLKYHLDSDYEMIIDGITDQKYSRAEDALAWCKEYFLEE